jgi:hypothetical protein
MKMIASLFLLLSLAFVFQACKKDPVYEGILRMGDTEQAEVTFYNTLLYPGYDVGLNHGIDLDGDGVKDLTFYVELVTESTSTVSPLARIRTLHEGCEVLAVQAWDSTYMREGQQYSTTPAGDPAIISWRTFSCRMETTAFQLDTVTSRYDIAAKTLGSPVQAYGDFRSGSFDLILPNTNEMELVNVIDGTYYYSVETHVKDCPKFPQDTKCYIPVRLMTKKGPRLGWVLIRNDGLSIEIFEWALQR